MGLNMIAMAAKLGVGYWTGALSLVADGFDSLFDAVSNVIGLVGIAVAARPADTEHPYGHRRFETLAAISISLLLFLTTLELVQSALERLRNPELISPTITVWSFGALVVSIGVHVSVVIYELRAGRRLKSDVLVADALHTQADIYVSVSVIGGLIAVRLGFPVVDPLLALAIAVFIAKIGIDIIRESSKTLLDAALVPVSEIERVVMGVRDVRSCHDIRSRGHEDAVYVDLHIRVDPEMSTAQSHAVAHDVQHRLRTEIPAVEDVVVHVEPEDVPNPRDTALIPALRQLAEELGIAIHSITNRWADDGYHVEAHLALDGSLPLGEAHTIASHLEEEAEGRVDKLAEIVTHIEPVDGEGTSLYWSPSSAEEVARAIDDLVTELYGPGSSHGIRVYRVGDSWIASLHLLLRRDLSLSQAHRATMQLEGQLRDAIPRLSRVVVHTEPLDTQGGT
jgi:cation diffusion facilitator family transporter